MTELVRREQLARLEGWEYRLPLGEDMGSVNATRRIYSKSISSSVARKKRHKGIARPLAFFPAYLCRLCVTPLLRLRQ